MLNFFITVDGMFFMSDSNLFLALVVLSQLFRIVHKLLQLNFSYVMVVGHGAGINCARTHFAAPRQQRGLLGKLNSLGKHRNKRTTWGQKQTGETRTTTKILIR